MAVIMQDAYSTVAKFYWFPFANFTFLTHSVCGSNFFVFLFDEKGRKE